MIRWALAGCAALLVLPALAIAAASGGINVSAPSPTAVADIPPDYLLLYQEAGLGFDVPWPVLAGVGKVECDHGRNPDPACWKQGATNAAGAGGPMQFLASTWQEYGLSASGSGTADRWNPADAIVSTANFLKQNGAPDNIEQAVFAYWDYPFAWRSGRGSDSYAYRLRAFWLMCRPAGPAARGTTNRASTDFIGAWPGGPVPVLSARSAGAPSQPQHGGSLMATSRMADAAESRVVFVGVDTHRDAHVAAARDQLGAPIGQLEIDATPAGYQQLATWAESLGTVGAFGIESTGSWGAGLTRFLQARGHQVFEVETPTRRTRRCQGKSDPVDAAAAAAALLAGETTTPKTGDGRVEMLRVLRVTRSSAVKQKTETINVLKAIVVTAPAELREELRALPRRRLVATCARLRPGTIETPTAASKAALRSLAQRWQTLNAEIKQLDVEIARLTSELAPGLVSKVGVGPETAAALLIAAGDNPERLRSEGSFAKLTGSAPVEASSGQVIRHRLNRGGDRQANAALHRIVIVRMRHHEPTRTYITRRLAEGKSLREAIRCLKRYVAREVYGELQAALASPSPKPLPAMTGTTA